jgi:hypothetical protein
MVGSKFDFFARLLAVAHGTRRASHRRHKPPGPTILSTTSPLPEAMPRGKRPIAAAEQHHDRHRMPIRDHPRRTAMVLLLLLLAVAPMIITGITIIIIIMVPRLRRRSSPSLR